MKFGAIPAIISITLVCFSSSNNPMASEDELAILRKVLTGPLRTALPGVAPQVLSLFAFVLTLGDNPVSTDDLMKELKELHKTADNIHELLKLQPKLVSERTAALAAIENDEVTLTDAINLIERKFKMMRMEMNDTELLQDNVKNLMMQGGGSVHYELERLVDRLNPSILGRTSILEKIYNDAEIKIKNGEWCDNRVSLNEYIWRKYRHFMMTIAKGYALIQEANSIGLKTVPDQAEKRVNTLQKEYNEFKKQFSNNVAKMMAGSSVSIRRCDPPEHKRGETYLEFERLIQGYLAHEYSMTKPPTGSGTCEDHQNPRLYDHYDFRWYSKCWGNIYNCRSTGAIELCLTKSPYRRYDGVLTHKGLFLGSWPDLGNTTNCGPESNYNFSQPSGLFYRTEPCGCYCDDLFYPYSFRRLDGNPVFSDYENNMVVTGLRLVNDSNVLRFEIQQGKIGEFGQIDAASVNWKKRESISPSTIIKLSWSLRSVNLNPVTLPENYTIIGVAFTQGYNTIHLQVYARPVIYQTGKMLNHISDWNPYGIFIPKNPQSELEIINATIPSLATRNVLIDGKNKFIKLQPSDWEKDLAQTLVPYLDIQEVVSNPPTLLGGLGFAYRSKPGYGGFLSLELQSWNFTNWVLE